MNLGRLLETVYREMHDEVVDGIATGGSATTIVDTSIITKFPDAKFKNWVAFITTTTDGLDPQNKYAVVTGNVNSTGVITIPTLTQTVDANDTYSIVKATIPLNTLVKLCNDALKMIGRIWQIDTSLSTPTPPTPNTRNYSLPVAMKGADLRSVYLRDANNFRYDAPPYDILPAVGGTATTTLQFKSNPLQGRTIVINYMAYSPDLSVYNSAVNETIPDRLMIAAALERAYHWKAHPKRRKTDMDNWAESSVLYQQAVSKYPIQKMQAENLRIPINIYN